MAEKSPKEKARDYMEQRQQERRPPLSQEEIRRALGWDLAEQARIERERQKLRR